MKNVYFHAQSKSEMFDPLTKSWILGHVLFIMGLDLRIQECGEGYSDYFQGKAEHACPLNKEDNRLMR